MTRHLRIGTHILYANGCKAQVRAHGEVGNGGDQGDGSGDVVEDTLSTWLGESQTPEDEGRGKHHGSDGLSDGELKGAKEFGGKNTYPVPVRSMGGDGDVSGTTIDGVTVDIESIIPHYRYECTYECSW